MVFCFLIEHSTHFSLLIAFFNFTFGQGLHVAVAGVPKVGIPCYTAILDCDDDILTLLSFSSIDNR